MQLIDNGSIRKLIANEGCRLRNIITGSYYEFVYLGKFDSVDNYKDVLIEEEPSTQDEIDELKAKTLDLEEMNLSSMEAMTEVYENSLSIEDTCLLAMEAIAELYETILEETKDGGVIDE